MRYQHIHGDKQRGGDLIKHLRCQKVYRKRYGSAQLLRGMIKHRVGIGLRPGIVDQKTRIGDWEGDTVIGKAHQGALVTLVDRCSRYTLARRVESKHAGGVSTAINRMLRPYNNQSRTNALKILPLKTRYGCTS